MNKRPIIYAIVPARSGSKGLPNKNIKSLAGVPLMAYSIAFARQLPVDRVLCSTDSEEYAEIAREYGAEVPFLRSKQAASDHAMEEDILVDFSEKFKLHNLPNPDILVWLRPTFIFRDLEATRRCIDLLVDDPTINSTRTIAAAERRLYHHENGYLKPSFDDQGKSMIRRQDIGDFYKVYSTDVFRFDPQNIDNHFLGSKIVGVEIGKVCGMDIDDEVDFLLAEALLKSDYSLVEKYVFLD